MIYVDLLYKVDVPTFVRTLGRAGGAPLYLFDLELFGYCPGLLDEIRVPAHLSTVYLRQLAGKCSDEKCTAR